MKKYIFVLLITIQIFAEEAESQKKVVVEYKKYEKFDLGNLEIKGQIIAPGDLSVRQRKRKRFKTDAYKRDNFRDNIYRDQIFQR